MVHGGTKMNHRRSLASIEEVSEYLGIPTATLYQWRHKGVGPRSAKVGRWVRYRWDDVEVWLDRQSEAAA
jgi:excisionase family DNA binding protein